MSFFNILFYFLLFLSALFLLSIVMSLSDGRRRSAWTTLRIYLVIVAIYSAILLSTTLAMPIRTLPMGEAQYSGDWSIAPTSFRRLPHELDEDYEVDFRMSDHGSAPLRGPSGLFVYLLSEDGTRYDPAPKPSDPPFDVLIRPGKSAITTRKFVLPTNLNRVELVISQRGLRLSWFVIGRSPFDGRTAILLQ